MGERIHYEPFDSDIIQSKFVQTGVLQSETRSNDMRIRRQHLIEEANAELDLAYEVVKRAENRLIALDIEFGDKITAAEKTNGAKCPKKSKSCLPNRIKEAFRGCGSTLYYRKIGFRAFSGPMRCFLTVCTHLDDESIALAPGNTGFRPGGYIKIGPDVEIAVRGFARSLGAYTTKEASK